MGTSTNNDGSGNYEFAVDDSDDPELALALRMSIETSEHESKGTESKIKESDTTEGTTKEEKMDVDEAPAKQGSKPTTGDDGGEEDYSEVMNDPEFLQSVLESLPGVDPQSEAMRQAMGALTGSAKKDDKDEKKKNDDKDKK